MLFRKKFLKRDWPRACPGQCQDENQRVGEALPARGSVQLPFVEVIKERVKPLKLLR